MELLWWQGCPSWEEALAILREEMSAVGTRPGVGRGARGSHRRGRRARGFRGIADDPDLGARPAAARWRAGRVDLPRLQASRREDLAAARPRRPARDACKRDRRRWSVMAQATATKVGEPAPALELPDTEGDVHTLPMPGEAPATVVFWTCNHCPYALAWHERLVAGRARLRRPRGPLPRRQLQRRGALPRRLARGDARAGRATRTGRSRTCTTQASRRRATGPPRSPRTSTCSTAICGCATRALPTPTTWIPRQTRPGSARRSTTLLSGGQLEPCRDRARRVLDQVEVIR